VGAVSYALGSFSKEPIAGITPIQEMTAETARPAMRPVNARLHMDLPITQDGLVAAFRKALNWNRPFADRAADIRASGVSAVAGIAGDQLGTLLRPIADAVRDVRLVRRHRHVERRTQRTGFRGRPVLRPNAQREA
jgi:hypothetical protein